MLMSIRPFSEPEALEQPTHNQRQYAEYGRETKDLNMQQIVYSIHFEYNRQTLFLVGVMQESSYSLYVSILLIQA